MISTETIIVPFAVLFIVGSVMAVGVYIINKIDQFINDIAGGKADTITLTLEELEGMRIEDVSVGGATQRTYGQNEGWNAAIDELLGRNK